MLRCRFLRDPVATPTVLIYDDGRNPRAVDLATGRVKWTTPSNDQFGNSPTKELAVAGGVLVAGQLVGCDSASDPNGHLAG